MMPGQLRLLALRVLEQLRATAMSGDELRASQIRFLGEQDGPPERELKAKLAELLRCEEVIRRAYLACVAYHDYVTDNVALCLKGDQLDSHVVTKVGQVVGRLFGTHEHLGIVFLDGSQEAQLARFASRSMSPSGMEGTALSGAIMSGISACEFERRILRSPGTPAPHNTPWRVPGCHGKRLAYETGP
jgi:hypothetical protein